MNHIRDYHDDALDNNGVIRDGKTFRVPLFMIDGKAVHIPSVPQDDAQSREQLYADAEARLTNAWRNPSAPAQVTADQEATNDASAEPATLVDAYSVYHDKLTSAWRNPPSMAPIVPSNNAESLLPPPSASMTDERAKLYAQRNEQLENAWRSPA